MPTRLLRFRSDLLPFLRSRKSVEVIEDEDSPGWGSEGGGEEAPRSRLIVLATFGLVAGGVLAAVVWAWGNFREPPDAEPGPARAPLAERPGRELEDATREVMRVVSGFVAATTLEEKLKWVLQTEGIEQKMGDYYTRHPAKARQIYDFPVIALTQRAAGNFYKVQALTVDNQRLNFAMPVTDDGPLIAWEAHIGYCEIDWDEFVTKRPPQRVRMRVYGQPATHYVTPFEDKTQYLSVELTRPDSDEVLYGYLSRTDTIGLGLMKGAMLSGKPEPMILELRFPDADRPVVLVEEFVRVGWFSLPYEWLADG